MVIRLFCANNDRPGNSISFRARSSAQHHRFSVDCAVRPEQHLDGDTSKHEAVCVRASPAARQPDHRRSAEHVLVIAQLYHIAMFHRAQQPAAQRGLSDLAAACHRRLRSRISDGDHHMDGTPTGTAESRGASYQPTRSLATLRADHSWLPARGARRRCAHAARRMRCARRTLLHCCHD